MKHTKINRIPQCSILASPTLLSNFFVPEKTNIASKKVFLNSVVIKTCTILRTRVAIRYFSPNLGKNKQTKNWSASSQTPQMDFLASVAANSFEPFLHLESEFWTFLGLNFSSWSVRSLQARPLDISRVFGSIPIGYTCGPERICVQVKLKNQLNICGF